MARPTINDVAARAGVSKSLVSLAMRGSPKVAPASREAILAAARELGYRPNAAARLLADRRSRTVGILALDLHNPAYPEIIEGVSSAIREQGYYSMLVVGDNDPVTEAAELDKLLEFQVEGLVMIGHRLPSGAREVLSAACPGVLVSRQEPGVPGLDCVSNDDLAGGRLAVEHLVSLGHRRIVHVTGGDNDVANLRRRGYEEAMREHGLGAQVRCVPGDFTDAGGYRGAADALATGDRPTALFVANDIAAVGALAAAKDAGVAVPEQLSVIGYDGTALAGLRSLSLTTIAQPLASMGRTAATLLLDRVEHPRRRPRQVMEPPSLVVRETTSLAG